MSNKHLRMPLEFSRYMLYASEQICMMMIMRGSSMDIAEYDIKAIIHPANGTHHWLWNIGGNKI